MKSACVGVLSIIERCFFRYWHTHWVLGHYLVVIPPIVPVVLWTR